MGRAFISDFDGTISKIDFFYFVVDRLLTDTDMQPWIDYQQGKLRHVEAISQIFSKIRMDRGKFHKFILELPIEECFVETVHYCKDNNIDFYIISAGADYYIKVILDHLKISNMVKLISNKSRFSEDGLQIIEWDKNYPFYSLEYGISKKLAVEWIKNHHDCCIFAGDGKPDLDAAKIADVVFARGMLLELCQKHNIKTKELTSYCEILKYLKNG
jgi:2-hydroxy-3-keto-5-methylthiopentenyl-1-phosphate phosphatase